MRVFRKHDLFWILGLPIYLLLGVTRHELSHAVVGLLEGARVEQITVFRAQGHWGQVVFNQEYSRSWLVDAAPYLVDVFAFTFFFVVLMLWPCRRHWLWLTLMIIGPLSLWIDVAYAYVSFLVEAYPGTHVLLSIPRIITVTYVIVSHPDNDLVNLARNMSPYFLHALMALAFALGLCLLVLLAYRHVRFQKNLSVEERNEELARLKAWIWQHFQKHEERSGWAYLWRVSIETLLISFTVGIIAMGTGTLSSSEANTLALIGAVTLAPLLETMLFQMLPVEFLRIFRTSRQSQMLVSVTCFAILHLSVSGLSAATAGIVGGFYFVFTYTRWRKISRRKAFVMTACHHFLYNAIAIVSFGLATLVEVLW